MYKSNSSYMVDLEKSYLILKRETYYEHVDLFLREAIAKFDNGNCKNDIKEIDDFLITKNLDDPWLKRQLESINVNFLPKKIKSTKNNEKNKNFISNLRIQDKYEIEEINYFFTGNVSLYILSTLWSMIVGPFLDKELTKDCLGNRLDCDSEEFKIKSNYRLFKLYIHQYNQWRDGAIQKGLESLENKDNVLLIALDFKQCYYHLPVNWEKLQEIINKNTTGNSVDFLIFLTKVLEQIHNKYYQKTKNYLQQTHQQNGETTVTNGIPVGLPSSRILANWELKQFDENIQQKLRPAFYGRYVDDVLIVLNNPDKNIMQLSVGDIIYEYFIKTNILGDRNLSTESVIHNDSSIEEEPFYIVNGYDNLFIQNSKIIIHYYDHEHSWAGLKEFKEELRQKASEFRFLPEEDQYKDLVDEAYDLHYDGSIYRFRSVIGISENGTKLSHYLYKQQLKYWLCNDNLRDKTVEEIFRFYRGKNIFDYCRLWERVFTLFVISQKYRDLYQFNRDIEKTIDKLKFSTDDKISIKLIEDCKHYKKIALSMAIGYIGEKFSTENFPIQFISLVRNEYTVNENQDLKVLIISSDSLPCMLRNAMYLRHQNMFWPLLDYTDFKGNLTKFDLQSLGNDLKINDEKINNSTRFLQLDEFLLLKYLRNILRIKNGNNFEQNWFFHYDEVLTNENDSGMQESDFKHVKNIFAKNIVIDFEENIKLVTKIKSNYQKQKDFCLGIVNLRVDEKDIDASYNPRKKSNNNYPRQIELFKLINQGIQKPSCDLIIFPEVSIPFAWLPFMVNQARRSDIGFIFGLEHVVIGQFALNFVATVLPFKNEKGFSNVYLSLRLKNYYSPKEEHELSLYDLKRPEFKNLYEKFSWRGAVFPVYNCYELTDINHRGLFRSEIDLLVAVEYNPDINYFSNIIESVARDVHCYAVQANSSDYGDSRVISPQNTEKMNIIRVKGGDNAVLLKTTLNINGLREFQSRKYSPNHNEFKPTPAGYEHEKARKRNG